MLLGDPLQEKDQLDDQFRFLGGNLEEREK